jgi:hypothetical protein
LAWQDAGGFGGAVECDRLLPYLVVPIDQTKVRVSYINHLLDFPGKKADLRLALLTIYGQDETEP